MRFFATTVMVLLFATFALATSIDFTSSTFLPADGQSSFFTTVNGIGVSLQANYGTLQTGSDGIGIASFLAGYEPDEIEGAERLTVTLNFPQPLTIDQFALLNFYNEGYLEHGAYSLNGGSWIGISANPSQTPGTPGYLLVPVGQIANTIAFRADGLGFANCTFTNSEYSLAGMDVSSPIPEPATLGFVAIGIALIGLSRGRRGLRVFRK